MDDLYYMDEALKLAREACDAGEVPVGCVITLGDRIVGRGRNRREQEKNALCHAEIEAINDACRTLGGWRLWQCTLYVTLEPCPMCAGPLSMPGSPGWYTAPRMPNSVPAVLSAACFPCPSTTTPG